MSGVSLERSSFERSAVRGSSLDSSPATPWFNAALRAASCAGLKELPAAFARALTSSFAPVPPPALDAAEATAEPRSPVSDAAPVPDPNPPDAASSATSVVESTHGANATRICLTVPSSMPARPVAPLSAAAGLAVPVAAPRAH